jgi:hypothetical protein
MRTATSTFSPRLPQTCFAAALAAFALAAFPFGAFASARGSGRAAAGLPAGSAAAQKKDYLTDEEGDKIRDAYTPAARIKLFLEFADDRLKKFDYELNRKAVDPRREEVLNALLNAYAGCADDAADQIDAARERRMDIRDALKAMKAKYQAFLEQLQKYDSDNKSPDFDSYKDTLEDAIEGTKDALSDVADAEKQAPGPPVRRAP